MRNTDKENHDLRPYGFAQLYFVNITLRSFNVLVRGLMGLPALFEFYLG